MATEWYYSQGKARLGPVSSLELRELAALGQLQPTDLVWKDGFAEWVAASKVKDLTFATPKAVASSQTPPKHTISNASADDREELTLAASSPAITSTPPIRTSHSPPAPRYTNLHRYLGGAGATCT